ncbi:MAG: hypothetical protein WEA77_07490 [Hyphomonas sp.]|uniref:hypothetical protein n=1 Tax=Hyphomonas sp. TaxID=87 RepID=UPI0034A09D5A
MTTNPVSTDALIELRIENIALLFDPLDPFPTPTRDLSKSAEDFIVEWARELPRRGPIRLILHIPSSAQQDVSQLRAAFSNHFRQRARGVKGDISELFGVGRTSLVIGLTTLIACVLGGQAAVMLLGAGSAARVLSEGLIIIGWVANWRPLEIFLYGWWPLARRRKLYQRLADMPIDVVTA